jgi:hypothetical protein
MSCPDAAPGERVVERRYPELPLARVQAFNAALGTPNALPFLDFPPGSVELLRMDATRESDEWVVRFRFMPPNPFALQFVPPRPGTDFAALIDPPEPQHDDDEEAEE